MSFYLKKLYINIFFRYFFDIDLLITLKFLTLVESGVKAKWVLLELSTDVVIRNVPLDLLYDHDQARCLENICIYLHISTYMIYVYLSQNPRKSTYPVIFKASVF